MTASITSAWAIPTSSNVACNPRLFKSAICTALETVSGFLKQFCTMADVSSRLAICFSQRTSTPVRSLTSSWTFRKASARSDEPDNARSTRLVVIFFIVCSVVHGRHVWHGIGWGRWTAPPPSEGRLSPAWHRRKKASASLAAQMPPVLPGWRDAWVETERGELWRIRPTGP